MFAQLGCKEQSNWVMDVFSGCIAEAFPIRNSTTVLLEFFQNCCAREIGGMVSF
jgi:hypothetical protein